MTQLEIPTPAIPSAMGNPNQEKSKEINHPITVVKRNGMLVPFRRDRIANALECAFRDTKKIGKTDPLPPHILKAIQQVTDLVVEETIKLALLGAALTVEGIQDIVEMKLMQEGHHDIARDYIIYRDQHKALREDSPRNLRVLRSDGVTFARLNPMKIAASVENAFRIALHIEGRTPDDIVDAINTLTNEIVDRAISLAKDNITISVELIQDEIENHLMARGFYQVAKHFILERALKKGAFEELTSPRIEEEIKPQKAELKSFHVTKDDGTTVVLKEEILRKRISFACRGYEPLVSVEAILQGAISQFYEGVKESEVDLTLIYAARTKIETEPAYSKVASGLLLDLIYKETIGIAADADNLIEAHQKHFKEHLQKAIELDRLSPALLDFDLEKISAAMNLDRDALFGYLGLQTLYDRYFIHDKQRRVETPQYFWMRVAMGLAIGEGKQKNQRAIEFYNLLSSFHFVSSTPTLFNSGTKHSQLSSCYLSTVMDDLHHIFKVVADDAQLSKWAGGIGNDWSNVRATGATIKGTNGSSQGVIPFLKVANDTAVAVNQCFAPNTLVYSATGTKPICDIKVGDLVLGISGIYREVCETFIYNQHGPMVAITIKHALDKVCVTDAHPFYAIRRVPMEQSIARTLSWLDKDKISCEWVEAGQLQEGDYVAQVIPSETVVVDGLDIEDARLYGILLGDGHLSKEGYQFGVSGNPQTDTHLEFVRNYLSARGIHYWETSRGDSYQQIHFASGRGAVRDATTGRIVGSGEATLPFRYDDLYDEQKRKHIATRLSHLPKNQTLALIQGLLETDGNVSRGKEVTFTNTSEPLVNGLRYQLLRLGIPTSKGRASDLRIPATADIAKITGSKTLTKQNWFIHNGHIFTRVKKVESMEATPFVCDLKVDGDASYMTTAALAHNGGKRKGAMCAYLETWHLDIEDFLELRKNTGDERRRTHDMNTANWIPDLFMKRVSQNGTWTLFSPSDVPDLHDLYGEAFDKRYAEYEMMAESGKIKLFKKIEAVTLWRKMLGMLFETGHPWITFKDPSNIRSPQDHVGVVHSSNLCTEILLNTSAEETAVCNLGSINLALHCTPTGLNKELLASTIRTAIRMLDNVIDINFYPTIEAKNANTCHRPVGLGIMGFQDALYIQNISYASHEAVEFADASMEMISYYAILASSELANERGAYPSYKGSKWDRGLLPIDTLELLAKERGPYFDVDRGARLDWGPVRASIKKHGIRNSNTMAIAPTATISNITGITQSIEPMYKHLFVKSNLSGEFTVPNTFLVDKLKELHLWDEEMIDDLKYFDGSILEIERIPDDVKKLFLTAFEIEPEWLIECASRRQKWIDMGQSLNLYLADPSGKKLHNMYMLSWTKGLKTNYYLRSLGATQIEKSTTDINKRGLQPRWMKNKSASANIVVDRAPKEGSSCNLGEACESCQ